MSRFYKPLLQRYLAQDRTYRYEGLQLQIKKEVFHPAFFGSSKVFAAFLKKQALNNKKVLEIGCGSGLLSLVVAQQGAAAWAVDVNPLAVACTERNALDNELIINTLQSDVFNTIPKQFFDFIIVNPPFFEGTPNSLAEFAWYTGADFQFFHHFFTGLEDFIDSNSLVYMILSEACALDAIECIAIEKGYQMKVVHQQYRLAERFLIFSIETTDNAKQL
ncbi:MAG: hypothetical protein DHS20C18_15970 [Saprospiraceae bacterium]|nr:MAG: hypothetical protein DHS20C18_15970 [Saprospiraceae bacterium]